jgi:hypothetical protein
MLPRDAQAAHRITGDLHLNAVVGKNHQLQIGWSRLYEDYTAGLVERNLRRSQITGQYHFAPPARLGAFAQVIHARQSDQNVRRFAFASVYLKLMRSPLLKTGVNITMMTHQFSQPEAYFSPRWYNAGELFVDLMRPRSIQSPVSYQLQAAFGAHRTNYSEAMPTFRISADLGYRLASFLNLRVYAHYGNTVVNASSAYQAVTAGMRLEFQLPYRLKPGTSRFYGKTGDSD